MVRSTYSWYEDFLGRLLQLRQSVETVRVAAGAFWFLAAALTLTAVAILSEMVFSLDILGRTLLAYGLAVGWLVLFAVLLGPPILRRFGLLPSLTDDHLARLVGARFPRVRDRLLNLLQLYYETRRRDSPYSPELIDAAGQQLADDIRPLDFSQALDRSPLRQSRRALAVLAVGILLFVMLFPRSFLSATERLIQYSKPFTPENAVSFSFEPEHDTILKGSAFSAAVRITAVSEARPIDPQAPLIFLWTPDNQAISERLTLRPDSPGVYRVTIPNVRTNAEYAALFDGFRSASHLLVVLDAPVLRSLRVRLDYPRYTGLPPKLQEEFVGDIAALPGTIVTLTGIASNELRSAKVRFTGGGFQEAQLRDRSFTARFTVSETTGYTLDLVDLRGLQLADPISYSIVLIDDQVPSIQVLEPGRNLDIPEGGTLSLRLRITDDYGFSSLRLAYRLIQSRYERPWEQFRFVDIPLPPGIRAAADVSYPWSLDPLDLVPEDIVEYAADVFDNDLVRGPKSARSSLYLLRLPSLDEVFADADTSQRRSLDQMQDALRDAQELKEAVDKIEQDMKQNKPLDWQEQKNLEAVSKKYQDIQQSLQRIQKELEQTVSSMQQQDALSPETMEKYLELQGLFEQLNSAELQQALQQLQQAMQSVNRQQLQEAMQQLKFSEDQFRASIDRTISLLKRIQIEQKLDETIRRTNDVRSRQSALQDHVSNDSLAAEDPQKLATQQQDLEQAQRELEAAARDVENRMKDFFAEMPLDRMEDVNRQLNEQALPQQMERSSQQLRSGQRQASAKTQTEILRQLDHLASDLSAIQQQLLEQQSQYAINALRQATADLLELSRRQEELKSESSKAQGNSPATRQNAQEQTRALEALAKVAQSLAELGQRSFAVTPQMAQSIGQALQAMQRALQSLDMRNAQAASRSQAEAMGALNSSAMAVQDALDAMMQGGSGGGPGGLMQQLQSLAGQQQSLNAKTQSMEAAAQAARLAAEQAAIQKSLEQLDREAQRAGESERLLGDLEDIARQMNEVVRSLEQSDMSSETVQRQERILSRLLDASHSLRERDFEKRRKATTGTAVARTSPPELQDNLLQGGDRLRLDLLRALEQGYSKEYEELIQKYFEQLQKIERERR